MKPDLIRFIILLTLQLLSLPCFIFVFYKFYSQRQLRQSLHHHVILLLLIVSFLFVTIPLPFTEAYMYTSTVYPATHTFCSAWNWIQYSVNITNLFLMGFASMERYWLIFHPWLVRSRRGKILFHYLPLLFCLTYPLIFYFSAIFIWRCHIQYSYTELFCRYPCYFDSTQWYNFDLYFNNYAPLIVIPVFCVLVYLRVFLQKRTMKMKAFKWSRDKKMILQLWAISSLYLAMWMPTQIAGLINLYWDPTFMAEAQFDYMYLFPYFIHLIYPFIVVATHHHEMLKFSKVTQTQVAHT